MHEVDYHTAQENMPGNLLTLLIGFLALTYYAVGFDQGILQSLVGISIENVGGVLHEFFHDGRHLIGFSCH